MKKIFRPLPLVISCLLLVAYFDRESEIGFMLIFANLPFLLIWKSKWAIRLIQSLLFLGTAVWIHTALSFISKRMQMEQPWHGKASIFIIIIIFTFYTLLSFEKKIWQEKYQNRANLSYLSPAAFMLTVLILVFVNIKVKNPTMLIFERFIPTSGWFEIFILGVYSAIIVEKFLISQNRARIRSRIWLFFSIVFFSQFILGLLGIDKLLMTGKIHIPLPALIIGGPLYKGGSFFMPILFLSTLILVGPAWCSHLCYIGSWDDKFARMVKKPKTLKNWQAIARIAVFFIVIAVALILRISGASIKIAASSAISFGIIGIIIMVTVSRKSGTMFHCITWCPIGLLANLLGKISPFRIKILAECDSCNLCIKACRYNALKKTDIARKKTGITCTLCGDCLGSCKNGQLAFAFYGNPNPKAQKIFYVLIISLHAAFLGLARI